MDRTINISTDSVPTPPPVPSPAQDLAPSLVTITNVIDLTSLDATGGKPSRLSNLGYSNVISSTNQCTQNAVTNQQAHAQLALSITGKTVNRVQNLGPMLARSSVDVLTDNSVADEIAGLRAAIEAFSGGGGKPSPVRWKALLQAIQKLLAQIRHINAVNAHVQGSGTFDDPYRVEQGRLFVAVPITLGFPFVEAGKVTFDAGKTNGLRIGG